jgi:multiple sugar transport system ATP-binding protein
VNDGQVTEYLQVQNLTRRYRSGDGIGNVSFSCAEGSFTVILGPSGAGKTTTVSIIAGIQRHSEGDVLMNGRSIVDDPPGKRGVSMAFEDYALYPTHSVFENIASPLRARKVPEVEIQRRVGEIAKLVGIDQHLEKLPSQISGGQKQRTGLARCLVRDADVYILDEPIAHLDAKLRHRMRGEFRRIHRELGKTMIYVSHDFREALALADKIVVMRDGSVVQIGSPEEVFFSPATVFVATLLGDPAMNLVHFDSVEVRDGTMELRRSEATAGAAETVETVRISGTPFSDMKHEPVQLGFRDFTVALRPDRVENCLAGSVFVSEPMEDLRVFTVKTGPDRVKIRADRSTDFEIDQPVFVELDPHAVYLFDSETGQNLGEGV